VAEIVGRYVEVEGCRTYYESAGSGPALVFLPPAGRESVHWHAFLHKYANGYRALAPDLPGHGKSAFHYGPGKYLDDIRDMARFVRRFWQQLGIERAGVVGCSLGGNLAYALAALFPDEVTAIVPLQGAAYTPLMSPAALEFLTHPHVNFIDHLADNVASLTGSGSTAEGRKYLRDSLCGMNAEALKADLTAYGRCDLRPDLGRIKCAVLSIRGTEDWLVTEEFIDMTLDGLGGARAKERVALAGIGHFPHVEAPKELFRLIDPFFARYYPAKDAGPDSRG
jgi:pimeloyl-ACP methyl ester carboxylesterase